MAHDASSADFDIDCLRHVVADEDVRRVSLIAAMIKMHALAIARAHPSVRDDATEIVRYIEQIYPALPNRASLRDIVRRHQPRFAAADGHAGFDSLIDAIWEHFRNGRI